MDYCAPISMSNVIFRLQQKNILLSINLSIKPNERILLMGPNGSGKSTLLKIMAGLLKSEGSISIFGNPPFSFNAKQNRAYVPQKIDYPAKLTVGEIIDFVQRHYLIIAILKHEILKLFQLNENEYAAELSQGQQRRLVLILALLAKPKLLLLDEPESGLDVQFRETVLNELILRPQKHNMAIVMASHFFESAIHYFDRVIFLKNGTISFDNSMEIFIKQQKLKGP